MIKGNKITILFDTFGLSLLILILATLIPRINNMIIEIPFGL